MADFGRLCTEQHLPLTSRAEQLPAMSVVSEHVGQGEAMPQQNTVQNAEANAEKPEQDQADIEAATMHSLPSKKIVVASDSRKHLTKLNVRKLTRAQKSKLVDQLLKVTSYPAANSTLLCNAPAASEHGRLLGTTYSAIDFTTNRPHAVLQSRDADTEIFLGELKARMDRCGCCTCTAACHKVYIPCKQSTQ